MLLGDRKGSIVVMDPRDGSILALWSFPSYDPNQLSVTRCVPRRRRPRSCSKRAPTNPCVAGRGRSVFFPGSTFKVVTGSTGLETGKVTPDNPVFPAGELRTTPPDGTPIQNFGGEVCGGALFEILRVSCNSAFAQMGAEVIGQRIDASRGTVVRLQRDAADRPPRRSLRRCSATRRTRRPSRPGVDRPANDASRRRSRWRSSPPASPTAASS